MHSVALGLHCQLFRQRQYSTILRLRINPTKDRKLWPFMACACQKLLQLFFFLL